MTRNADTTGASPTSSTEERLDSWKEIASYLHRDVRTVQRWEKSEGLPVRRLQHDKLGSVYAFKSELDEWVRTRQPEKQTEAAVWGTFEPEDAKEEDALKDSGAQTARPAATPLQTGFWIGLVLLVFVAAAYYLHRINSAREKTDREIARLVVLPFQNLSQDPQQDYLSDGFTEEMTTQLGRLQPSRLRVMARTTAMLYKGTQKTTEEIAKDLSVDYILEGSVRKADGRIRISAQLIQGKDGTHVWAENYDRDLSDILTLESEVAQAIAGRIQIVLSPQQMEYLARQGNINPDAYDAYAKGLYYWNQRTPDALVRSADFFNRAVHLQSNYALAYAALADSYELLGSVPNDVLRPRDAMPKAKDAAKKALQMDDSLAQAHAALALVHQYYDWDWQGAEREYKRALELDPGYAPARHWYALLLIATGRQAEALQESQKALELAHELDPVIGATLAESYYFSRQYDLVMSQCQKTLAVNPNFYMCHYFLGPAYVEKGMTAEGIAELEKARDLAGTSPAILALLGNAYAVAGRKADAGRILDEFNALSKHQYVPAVYFAAVYIGLSQKDQAFQWLEKAYQERVDYLIFLNVEPMDDALRSDPRFQDLIRRIGLPPNPPRPSN